MAKSKQTFSKKEKEAKRLKKRKEKVEKREDRKTTAKRSFEDMIAYVDEFGQLSSSPPDPKDRVEMKLEDIQLGARIEREDLEPELPSGRVTYFNDEKGYGFIKNQRTKESIFFHSQQVTGTVAVGDMVTFQMSMGNRGPAASAVVKI